MLTSSVFCALTAASPLPAIFTVTSSERMSARRTSPLPAMLTFNFLALPVPPTSPLPEMRMPSSSVARPSSLASPEPDSDTCKTGVVNDSTFMSPEPDAASDTSLGTTTVTSTLLRELSHSPRFQRTCNVAPWLVVSTVVSSMASRLSSACTCTDCTSPWRTARSIAPDSEMAWNAGSVRVSVAALPEPCVAASAEVGCSIGTTARQHSKGPMSAARRVRDMGGVREVWEVWDMGHSCVWMPAMCRAPAGAARRTRCNAAGGDEMQGGLVARPRAGGAQRAQCAFATAGLASAASPCASAEARSVAGSAGAGMASILFSRM